MKVALFILIVLCLYLWERMDYYKRAYHNEIRLPKNKDKKKKEKKQQKLAKTYEDKKKHLSRLQ